MDKQYDVIVIGAGPGGYVTALKSAKLGFQNCGSREGQAGWNLLKQRLYSDKGHDSCYGAVSRNAIGSGVRHFAENVRYDYEKTSSYRDDVINKLASPV